MPSNLFDVEKNINPTVNAIQDNFKKQYKVDFDNTKKQWTRRIHSSMRESMKLKLTTQDEESGLLHTNIVQVKILPDYGNRFVNRIDELFPNLDFEMYSKMEGFLDQAIKVENYYHDSRLSSEFTSVKKYAENIVKAFNLKEISQKLFQDIFEYQLDNKDNDTFRSYDVLGAYFIETHHIEIYYVPILIFSILHKISTNDLFLVVLAHEYAHAYSHIGLDIDKKKWELFRETDKSIKESIAQFYAEQFCLKYLGLFPNIFRAYETLLKYQPQLYNLHVDWKDKYSLETIRGALIATRLNGKEDYEDFSTFLEYSS